MNGVWGLCRIRAGSPAQPRLPAASHHRQPSWSPCVLAPPPHLSRGLLSQTQVSLGAAQEAGRGALPTAQELQEQNWGGGGRLFSEPQDACWTDGETGSEVPCLPACLPAWRLAHLPVPGPALSAATMPSRGPCLMLLSQHPAMLNRFWTTGISFCSGLRKFGSQPCPGQREKDRRCWCPPPTCPTRGISALFPGKPCSVPGVRRLTLGAARCPFSGSQATWGV